MSERDTPHGSTILRHTLLDGWLESDDAGRYETVAAVTHWLCTQADRDVRRQVMRELAESLNGSTGDSFDGRNQIPGTEAN